MPATPNGVRFRSRSGPRVRALIGCALFSFGSANALAAQQPGLPVEHSPAHLPVRGILADFGVGAGYAGTGTLVSFGGRLQTAFDRVQIMAGAHAISPSSDALDTGLGIEATIAVQLSPARPRRVINAQVGFAWTDFGAVDDDVGITFIDVPLSLAVGAYLPTPKGPAEAWFAPRLHIRHTANRRSFDPGTRVGPGLSAGLRFTTAAPQLGGSISVDALGMDDPARDGWRVLTSFDITLHLLLLRR